MRALAVLALVLWALGSIVYFDWKRGVVYPPRPFVVGVATILSELAFAALAISVIVRG